ncbi:molybdenum cofactor biosynthesis protein C [Pseudomonas aeruginosa]|nr:molybdenum cofactor biosynthesis protein C [Pseudomonas aeruginosa]
MTGQYPSIRSTHVLTHLDSQGRANMVDVTEKGRDLP